jgi:hypothetical protein
MVKVLAFDVDGVLTCDRCTPQRRAEQASDVRRMIEIAQAEGYKIAVNTARPYPSFQVQSRTELQGVTEEIASELRQANGGDAFGVCSRPRGSGMAVADRKVMCQQLLVDYFENSGPASADDDAPNMTILVEDNPSNYVRVGSLEGRVEHGVVSNGVLVPEANGVTADSVQQLRRALQSQTARGDNARRSRNVLAAAFDFTIDAH